MRAALSSLLLLIAACEHSSPFTLVPGLGFYRTRLVVAPTAHADDTTRFAWYIDYAATAGTVTGVLKPEWLDADRIRFLGAYEFFFKVKGGGQERYTDTTFVPLALLELDLRTGLVALVPGGDSATAWARAPDGGAWIVKAGDPARLLHLAAGMDVSTTVGVFTDSVRDLAAVAGTPVAVLGDTTIEWLDPVTGVVAGSLTSRTPVRRLRAVAGTGRVLLGISLDPRPVPWP